MNLFAILYKKIFIVIFVRNGSSEKEMRVQNFPTTMQDIGWPYCKYVSTCDMSGKSLSSTNRLPPP